MGKAFNLDDFWEGAKGEGEGRTTGVDAVDGTFLTTDRETSVFDDLMTEDLIT